GQWSVSVRRSDGPTVRQFMTRIAVVGGGAWGTALADLLARKGASQSVTLWAREPEVVDGINRDHMNPTFLPGAALDQRLRASGDLEQAVRGADVVVSSPPSHVVRQVMSRVGAALGRGTLVVSVSKGLEPERLTTLSCVLGEVLPRGVPIAVLSGPSFAQEGYQQQPPATFAGLAGMGDLILTATGPLSRNRSLGVELGRGTALADALAGRASVAEGVNTARAAVTLGVRHGVELPIAGQVTEVLFGGKPPRQAVA